MHAQGKAEGGHLAFLDAVLKRNPGAYAVGDTPTIADAAFFCTLYMIMGVWAEQVQSTYPSLVSHFDKIAKLPQLKDYVSSRKLT